MGGNEGLQSGSVILRVIHNKMMVPLGYLEKTLFLCGVMIRYDAMINKLSITDMYMSVLISLSVDEKLDLISKLTDSIRNKQKEKAIESADPFACYHGNWGDDLFAEELRKSHTFTRNVDNW